MRGAAMVVGLLALAACHPMDPETARDIQNISEETNRANNAALTQMQANIAAQQARQQNQFPSTPTAPRSCSTNTIGNQAFTNCY